MFVPQWQTKTPILAIRYSSSLLIPHHDGHNLIRERIGHLCGMFAPSERSIVFVLSLGLHLLHSDGAHFILRNLCHWVEGPVRQNVGRGLGKMKRNEDDTSANAGG